MSNDKKTNRNYSTITNFGCHWECPYCVVKNNKLNIPITDIAKTRDFVINLIAQGEIDFLSFSGGGDPLFNADIERLLFFREINMYAFCNDIEREMHTSYINNDGIRKLMAVNLTQFDRIVYHVRNIEEIKRIPLYEIDYKRRVVFVVQDYFTEDLIKRIVKECKAYNIDELSFRQRITETYETNYHLHDFLKKGHGKDWHYIEQNDYNNYIVNNKIYKSYREIGKDEETNNVQ